MLIRNQAADYKLVSLYTIHYILYVYMYIENLDLIVNLLVAYCQRMHGICGGSGHSGGNVNFIKIKT